MLIAAALMLLVFFWTRDSTRGNVIGPTSLNARCPNYGTWCQRPHRPYSKGKLRLPYMRPSEGCRTFSSPAVEKVIEDMRIRMKDEDLFRLFENAFPNTLDTTIWWHDPDNAATGTPRTFVATGDIPAEWLRDSARQLSVYQPLIGQDPKLKTLIEGAIIQQALYISAAPYCNAFQPPAESKIKRKPSSIDQVLPKPDWDVAFECKWELDSLASFLTLTNDYVDASSDSSILNDPYWRTAFSNILSILRREQFGTFAKDGSMNSIPYIFQRETTVGSETLPLAGSGNPVARNTGMVRSAFRPSDDACIYQLFVPANAAMSAELSRLIPSLIEQKLDRFVKEATHYAHTIRNGIEKTAVVRHPEFGDVYAYEVDGYGGANIMDDANIPSLLALPDMGYVPVDNKIYQNTREMVLSSSNPYYVKGRFFEGIGGPHVGLRAAWPMSLLVRIRTTENDEEITKWLDLVLKSTGRLGLLHETVDVQSPSNRYTRPWFSWCNSEFAKTIFYLAEHKPYLIFNEDFDMKPYRVQGFKKRKPGKIGAQ